MDTPRYAISRPKEYLYFCHNFCNLQVCSMSALPTSIEAYLQDAGFTATEILILRRLIEEDTMTLRQLAMKTGKSTGVLDQAMKKLLTKKIVAKEWINDNYKFTMISLHALIKWVNDDLQKKREELSQRHQNFETFISTIKLDKKRPEMQYFEGQKGIEQAYLQALKYGKEMLHYFPVVCSPEDDPLRDFRVEYFRERRRQGVFARVIAHDTPLGRRFQSRDAFEYRQTILVPEEQYSFSFEKIIAGDSITCINFIEKRACFIHYPEMTSMERSMFESIWKRETATKTEVNEKSTATPSTESLIPLKTKTLSRLREFFLSKESLVSMAAFVLIAAVITFGLYRYTSNLNVQRLQEKVVSIAATGASQFSAEDLNVLRTEEDWQKPEWSKVVNHLQQIRDNNEKILFAYIIRKTSDDTMEFVADSHSINPYANTDEDPNNDVDANGDGKIDAANEDLLQWPGQPYPTPPAEALLAYQETQTSDIYEDQWGKVLTGYAPVLDQNGTPIAVLAIDMKAEELQKLNAQAFTPLFFFVAIIALFLFVRLTAFNRSLLKETWDVFQLRFVLISVAICLELAFFATLGMYFYTLKLVKQEVGMRLMSIAATASTQFESSDLEQLHFARDMKTDAYQRVFSNLNQIRTINTEIQFTYILRVIDKPYLWEFIADADSNYSVPFLTEKNGDNSLDETDENISPGVRYYSTNEGPHLTEALIKPTYSKDFIANQWGILMTGYAPILNEKNQTVAVLGIDTNTGNVLSQHKNKFVSWMWFIFFLAAPTTSYLIISQKKHFYRVLPSNQANSGIFK